MRSAEAEAEGLTLPVADNTAGYFGVHLIHPGQPKPYLARVWRGGKRVHLGSFATAEEAALCVARSPEGQAAAKRAASARPPQPDPAEVEAAAEEAEAGAEAEAAVPEAEVPAAEVATEATEVATEAAGGAAAAAVTAGAGRGGVERMSAAPMRAPNT